MKKLNKIIAIILVIAMMGSYVYAGDSSVMDGETPEDVSCCADVNRDGVINAEDALEVLKYACKCIAHFKDAYGAVQPIYLGELKIGDPSGDGEINAEDALVILKYAAGLIDKLPVDNQESNDDPQPTETTGYDKVDELNVVVDYTNSFIVEVETSESKVFTVADFPEVQLKDVWTRGKINTDGVYTYELVMVLGAEETLDVAMEVIEANELVTKVSYNDYIEHDSILELNYSEYVLKVGESIDLTIADYRPYDASKEAVHIILKTNGEELSLETLEEYGVTSLTKGSYVPTGGSFWKDYEAAETDYYISVYTGESREKCHLTVAHLLSQLSEIEMVQIFEMGVPTGARDYENWECSDESIATMTLSGGEEADFASTKLNQTATITAQAPGEMTVSVTKGGWGNAEATATCKISVVELGSETYIAEYPATVQYVYGGEDYDAYSKWVRDEADRVGKYSAHREALNGFYSQTITEALSDSNGENVVFSPLNIYMALSLIAETTDGNSRKQILDLIGVENIEALRRQSNDVWNSQYCDDGTVTTILANSVWLRDDTQYNGALLKTLAENYYASSFSGEMGSAEYDAKLRDWLNDQTGNLLGDKVSEISTNPENVLMLASTVYYRGKWASEFYKATENTFYTADGEVTANFMNKTEVEKDYYWGEKFGAVAEDIEYGGQMWFILPDEGVGVDALLKETELMDFILYNGQWENKKEYKINLSVPKFDIDSDIKVEEMLQNLGVTDIFSSSTASFAPLMADTEGVYVSELKHSGRIIIDEEGCTATSFEATIFPGDAPPEDKEIIDFNLNKPFIYVLTSDSGAPLYVGIVNNPT